MLAEVSEAPPVWMMVVGFVGQGIFGGRMLVQWIATERARQSVVPLSFWYMSVIGAMITLAYAILRNDPVFIVAQTGGLIVYIRNLYFLHANPNGSAGSSAT